MPIPTVPINGILDHTPDPFQKNYKVKTERNNVKGRVEISTSKDGGVNYKVLLPEPTQKTQPGSVLSVQEDGSVDWKSPASSSLQVSASNWIAYAEMPCAGSLTVNAHFGYYVAPIGFNINCIGLQLFLQTATSGADLRVDLITPAGSEQSEVTTLLAGQQYVQNIFSSPFLMRASTAWRLKIKQIGSIVPGEFLSARLILSPIS
jgi:hypothetical protein